MTERSEWRIEPITQHHLRESFECGVAELDEFIRRYARQSERMGLARTFVATTGTVPRVLDYFTLRSGSVEFANLPPDETKRFPRYPVPVVHLARLAVDRSAQAQGLGERLLYTAFSKAYEASKEIAVYAVEVIAIDGQIRNFYLKYGFRPLVHDELHLYLPIKTLAKLFDKSAR